SGVEWPGSGAVPPHTRCSQQSRMPPLSLLYTPDSAMNSELTMRSESVDADPLSPPQPVAPFFDTARNAWILSRYEDVLAALRDPSLWPTSLRSNDQPDSRTMSKQTCVRTETLTSLSSARLSAWQTQMKHSAANIIDR